MGFRGLTNCALRFEGAVGELVGRPHEGLACMFHMMDEARLDVGMNAAMLSHTAYLQALDYARTRIQGRRAGAPPDGPPVPIVEHGDVRRMLLAMKCLSQGCLALVLYSHRLVDEIKTGAPDEARDAQALLGLLTPIVKAYLTDLGLRANDMAIQVHGGAGYTRDFDAEMLYRDNRLNAIHEGANGIHALDLVGRQLRLERGRRLSLLVERIEATLEACGGNPACARHVVAMRHALANLDVVTAGLLDHPIETRLGCAYPCLELTGAVVVGWTWLELANAAARMGEPDDAGFAAGQQAACDYWFDWELPRAMSLAGVLVAGAAPWLAIPDTGF